MTSPASLSIIVSGGSRGLGAAIVQQLLESGHRVATFSRNKTATVEAWESDEQLAPRFFFDQVDAQDLSAVRSYVANVQQRFGKIEALINNAAVASDYVFALQSDEQISQMLDVNLKACLVLSRECVRCMLLGDGGVIVNISSIVSLRGFSGLAVYSATKAALNGMTRALARELGERNIRVNTLAPGYLETEMSAGLAEEQRKQIIRRTPLGRLGQVEDVVPWVEFLISPEASFMTGQTITVDGGSSV
ncbi:MAG: SDR family oxidoreductase [Pirellulaceae bacterium]|nr:SDR family oxidoreductase [Pirellulaceae bacterium]